MLIKNKKLLSNFILDLEKILIENKENLFKLNADITSDTDYWIRDDYNTIQTYLHNFLKNHNPHRFANQIKAKGKIIIILSYNEPFILSIIPILNALIIGNEVILKPSKISIKFVKLIWESSDILEKYNLKLTIVSPKNNKIENIIKKSRAVYFFGSYNVARSLAKICGKNYIEFYPEVEASDLKIFYGNPSDIKKDIKLTFEDSFSHSGQICQRIHGILIHKSLYASYVKIIKEEFFRLCKSNDIDRFLIKKYTSKRSNFLKILMSDIEQSKPKEVVKHNDLPLLVIQPKINSDFVKNAYFLPVLWVSFFDSKDKLVSLLNNRKFFLGINIHSHADDFINFIISNTKFTRYTINTSHSNIRSFENWGGSWPTGYNGYKSWLEHFSDKYVVIKK